MSNSFTKKIDEDSLLILLDASGKDVIGDIFNTCYRFRLETMPERKKMQWRSELSTSYEQIEALIPSVTTLIDECLLHSQLPSQILSADFHTQLAGLLNKIVKTNAATWKNNIMQNQISAPRLVDFNYRIDNTVSTDQMTNVNASSLLLNLHVQMQPTHKDEIPTTRNVQLELSHQELKTLLDGMLKIKDQLSTIQ
eukprot:UN01920